MQNSTNRQLNKIRKAKMNKMRSLVKKYKPQKRIKQKFWS